MRFRIETGTGNPEHGGPSDWLLVPGAAAAGSSA